MCSFKFYWCTNRLAGQENSHYFCWKNLDNLPVQGSRLTARSAKVSSAWCTGPRPYTTGWWWPSRRSRSSRWWTAKPGSTAWRRSSSYRYSRQEGFIQKTRQRSSLLFGGTEFIHFLAAPAVMHQDDTKKRTNWTRIIWRRWWIHPILQIVLVENR